MSVAIENRIEEFNKKNDIELHGCEATIKESGNIELRLWRNKQCTPTTVTVSKSAFLSGNIPYWEHTPHGWYIENI